ncbi:BREX-2 system adenine-specific DNA-methyltransferase PglX [Actinoallomurus sp. CA-142502]|uniref:BREX-2 system adenine-specific DNA-methyltransferase PglX n=1 Tax=Actinoallomurus sp. CA-142502 TaxID=3239885 RepID=UPI003D9057A8
MNQAALLKDLRGQVAALEADLRERSETVEEYRSALTAEYAAAREAQRIAATYTAWRDERVTQIAVAWVLATVFVRFCEDNELIEAAWIAGPGERLREAEDRHNAHFQQHPEQNDRDWLIAAIRHLASTNETVAGLFDEAHNPLWEMDISYDAASALLAFWRRIGPDGETVHSFTDREWNTRFLGDLYQNLSESARKTYALLQTPEFVEEFILDLTLKPAIKEFGLSPEWRYRPSKWPGPEGEMPTGLRTIDPACGSGHFLLGIFHRLLAKWEETEPGTDRWELIRRTLESVHGCDKNPFAVAIARFRLLLAALRAADEIRLDRAPIFPINIAVGDSLLHGRGAESVSEGLFSANEPFTYATEDIYDFTARCDLLGKASYHVVVGNPPYITVKDKQEKENYRIYDACAGAYALSIPFAQRIFELAIKTGGADRSAGFTGQITANSFMKREFGKKLINPFFTSVDLTHVIDTSGAYIPGHGTPTVILIGRHRTPYQSDPIRAVLGVRGEPSQPAIAANGHVWSAIKEQINLPGSESNWISVDDLPRQRLASFPWSLSGGGASDLTSQLEDSAADYLSAHIISAGFMAVTREDEAYFIGGDAARRLGLPESEILPVGGGAKLRDWSISPETFTIFPYNTEGTVARASAGVLRHLWRYRRLLADRRALSGTQEDRGLTWYEYSDFYPERWTSNLRISYAEVSTHNHFKLDRGGVVYIRTAPVINLPESSTEDDHLKLLGLLNSSTGCFWLKQVSHDKGIRGEGGGFTSNSWERFYQFNTTKLHRFPIPGRLPLECSRVIDALAEEYVKYEPAVYFMSSIPTRKSLASAREHQEAIRSRMISLQEELDWQIYAAYALISKEDAAKLTASNIGAIPDIQLGERAFEISLARTLDDDDSAGEWFDRHDSKPIRYVPTEWPYEYQRIVQSRVAIIEKRKRDIGLIERPEFKRRWATEPWEKREQAALRTWLLNQCERGNLWFGLRDGLRHPRTLTVSQLADQFRNDEDMLSVADLYATNHLGKRDMPLVEVLEEVIKDEHVPYLAALRYKDAGLSKRADWEQVWELQREEDRTGKRLDIAIPPKYTSADFKKPSYWSNRGKLDVPKERFISYPGASPDADDTLLLGWAGWDHKDQAQALVNLVNDRTEQAAWDTERLTPILAGLLEVMPWVHQWHGEYDADWEGVPAEEFQAFLDDQRGRHGLTEEKLRAWRPAAGRGRKKRS